MRNLRLLVVIWVCVLTPGVARAEGGWLDWLYSMDKGFVGSTGELNLACRDETNWVSFCENFPKNVGHLFDLAGITHKVPFANVRHEIDLRASLYHSVAKGSTGVDPGSMTAWRLGGSYYWHVPKAGWLEPGASVSVIHFNGGDWVQSVWSGTKSAGIKLVPGCSKGTKFHICLTGTDIHIEVTQYSHGLTGAAIAPGASRVTFSNAAEGLRWSFAFGINLSRVNVQP